MHNFLYKIVQLCCQMMKGDAKTRISWAEVLNHKVFDEDASTPP